MKTPPINRPSRAKPREKTRTLDTRPGSKRQSERPSVPPANSAKSVMVPDTAGPQPPKRILRLFVAGATTRSLEAILRVQKICDNELKDTCKLEVIDIYQQPALARENQIVATPTFIIEFPKPIRRFIGSLSHLPVLFADLDLPQKTESNS